MFLLETILYSSILFLLFSVMLIVSNNRRINISTVTEKKKKNRTGKLNNIKTTKQQQQQQQLQHLIFEITFLCFWPIQSPTSFHLRRLPPSRYQKGKKPILVPRASLLSHTDWATALSEGKSALGSRMARSPETRL